jgi:hypothetical protein
VIRRTALDVARNHGGKLENDGPMPEPLVEALRRAGALKAGAWVAVLCSAPPSIGWADSVREDLRRGLASGDAMPRWVYCVRNDVPDHGGQGGPAATRPDRIVYSSRWRSRIRRQLPLLKRWPTAVVVFDQTTDFPAVVGRWNLHLDSRRLVVAQLERDGWWLRVKFFARWAQSAARCMAFALRAVPYTSATKYG